MSSAGKKKRDKGLESAALAGAAGEVVQRYGSASKEHLVALTGKDNETGKTLAKGLRKIAGSKINPEYKNQNIRQQAGFSAESKYVARENAEKIIKGKKGRYTRTDDLGRVNDELFDHVLLDESGHEIPGTGEQMKFIGNSPRACLDKLKSGKFRKYIDSNATITVPSDYYQGILEEADKDLAALSEQLEYAESTGNVELARSIENKIERVEKIKSSVKDSGITTKEAVLARMHPNISTAKDIAKISHRAGVEQAKKGAVISAGFSLIRNVVAVIKGTKDASDAAIDFAKGTGEGAVVSYVTAFAGSAMKAGMQNSTNTMMRAVSKTNAPAMIVTSTIEAGRSITRYFRGEISGVECLEELGEKGTGNLSAAMFAAIGQIAIPVPIIGGMVGAMVGYALSGAFYTELKNSLKEAALAHETRMRIERECEEAISMIRSYRSEMHDIAQNYLRDKREVFSTALSIMDEGFLTDDMDKFVSGANVITSHLGGNVQFTTKAEFDVMMENKVTFKL